MTTEGERSLCGVSFRRIESPFCFFRLDFLIKTVFGSSNAVN